MLVRCVLEQQNPAEISKIICFLIAEHYLCAKLSQHCQRLKVEEIRPFNLTLPVRV